MTFSCCSCLFVEFFGGAKARTISRTRKMLQNAPTLAIGGLDTAENEPSEVASRRAKQLQLPRHRQVARSVHVAAAHHAPRGDGSAYASTDCSEDGRGRLADGHLWRSPELKGSIGEVPNHSNFSDRSSVKILSKFRGFR